MKNKGVYTTYTSGGRVYESYILAGTIAEADELARIRNIGEKVISEPQGLDILPDYRQLSDEEFMERIMEIMEQVKFLGYIGFASGSISLDELIGEGSAMDAFIDAMRAGEPQNIAVLRNKLRDLQEKAPGVFPARRGHYINLKVKAGTSRRVDNIVSGSVMINYGPATISVCDCAEPVPIAIGSGITDDDQPCGYEQTIDGASSAQLNTESSFIVIHNRDAKRKAKVRVRVWVMNGI
jgi:hypothetical protein